MKDVIQHAVDRCSDVEFYDLQFVNPPIEYSDELAELMATATGRPNTDDFKDEVFAAVGVLNAEVAE
jgi:hypothetical protein